ncbi:TonB-dependent receptor [Shewanella hanedai]|uniref:TonB-dependent receptor n=1 Tax=Shewanella hanedai TaxID=25 RepID=A0A553JK02_SHEHA|nr:TonB-dependent receptor [Shewanella hanedai]TRY12785.1 TonB-dependent receptor [Shewanella hanedai]GGI93179.1 TonB-dependent receptor [Shewanella hanedai]
MAWFRKSAVSLACLSVLTSASGLVNAADEQQTKQTKKEEMEIIEVKGIKSSLKKALNDKRFANQVADMISAEDIGKLPDENIADALQRVTGVTIGRNSGEGTTISVRGVAPGLSNVTINGQSQASASGEGREFSFDSIASEHVSALQVIKSPTADMEEGGIGATVNVVTRRALDFKDDRTKLTAFADYSELTQKTEPRLSALLSRQNEDKTFGFLLSANHSVRTLQEDALRGWGWRQNIVNEDDGAVEGAEVGDEYSYLNRLRYQTGTKERTRTGGTLSLQWQPTDTFELYLDTLYSQLTQVRDESYLETRFPIAGNKKKKKPVILKGSDSAVVNENGTLIVSQIDGAQVFNSAWYNEETTKTLTTTFGGSYVLNDNWELASEVGYSHIERHTDDNIRSFAEADHKFDLDYRLDGRFPVIDYYKDAKNVPISDTSELVNPGNSDIYTSKPANLRVQLFNIENTKATVKFDVTGTLDGDFFTDVKFGTMFKHQNKSRTKDEAFIKKFENHGLNEFKGKTITGLYEGSDSEVSSVSYNQTDLFKLRDTAQAEGIPLTLEPVPEFNYDVTEKTQAAYVRVDYNTEVFGDMSLRGNIGARYVHTDVESIGLSEELDGTDVERTIENDYSDVLPSFNVSLGLTDDLLLRGAVAKVMSRPALSDLSAHKSISENGDGEITIRQGNPDLDPYRATSYDLSLEWYFDEASVLSLAGFYKDVDSFIFDLRHDSTLEDNIDVATIEPTNGAGAKVKGYEIAFQHIFEYLPGFLNGFGLNLNYTYQDSDADFNREGVSNSFGMPGLSKDSYNAVVFYEKYDFSTRLAYNYRSQYLIEPSGRQENVIFGDDYGQLDFSASYDITKQLTVSFNAINLTESEQRQFAGFEERLYENYIYGRRYHLGFSYSF